MTGTPSNELAIRDDASPALRLPALPSMPDTDSWIRAMASISKLADQICDTSFVPKGLRGDPAAVTAAILTGRELGLQPMTALRHIHVPEGTPSLDAEYKRARVLAAGHEFRILEWDGEHCKIAGRRRGDRNPPLVVEYTIRDARQAGLVRERSKYITSPRVMMLARATTLICNAIFSDVTNGLATSELLEAGDEDAIADAIGAAVDTPPAPERQRVTADQARQRVQRVQSEVVKADPAADESPWPDGAQAVPPEPAPQPERAAAGDPRADVLAHLERLSVVSHDDRASYLTRLSGQPKASVESLTVKQARWFAGELAKVTNRDELEAYAVARETARETAAEASDAQ